MSFIWHGLVFEWITVLYTQNTWTNPDRVWYNFSYMQLVLACIWLYTNESFPMFATFSTITTKKWSGKMDGRNMYSKKPKHWFHYSQWWTYNKKSTCTIFLSVSFQPLLKVIHFSLILFWPISQPVHVSIHYVVHFRCKSVSFSYVI